MIPYLCYNFFQKQPFRGVLRKRYSENMQQIYRRTSIPKCDSNKFALQYYWNYTLAWVFACKFAAYFQKTFLKEHQWKVASVFYNKNVTTFMLQLSCYNFFMIKISYLREKNDKLWQNMLLEKNHSVIEKFRIPKGLKG